MKMFERLVEDDHELSKKTKREIKEARKRIKSGKFLTQKQVERDNIYK